MEDIIIIFCAGVNLADTFDHFAKRNSPAEIAYRDRSFSFVDMDNQPSQGPNAYRQTDYASANLIWQMRQRLSLGLEGLYGHNELSSGNKGGVGRVQIGVAYAIF